MRPAPLPRAPGHTGSAAALRKAGALVRGGPGQLIVTRYDDVAALLRDPRLSNEFPPDYLAYSVGDGPTAEFLRGILLHRDPPQHRALRRPISRALGPAGLDALRPTVVRLVDTLLDDAARRGTFDAAENVAAPLSLRVVSELVGVDPDVGTTLRGPLLEVGKAFSTFVAIDQRAAIDAAVEHLRALVGELVETRRRAPRRDVSSLLAASYAAGELSWQEAVDNGVFLLFAGFETTASMLASGCAALARDNDLLARIRGDPAAAQVFVEEVLRVDPPIASRAKVVVEPVEVAGRRVHAGRVLILNLASANLDDQSRCPHLSFGAGLHHCAGAGLARLEGELVFSGLAARFGALRAAGPWKRRPASAFGAYEAMPLHGTPRRRGGCRN